MFVWTICCWEHVGCLVLLFGYENVAVVGRTMARFDTLAQPSFSRLSKTGRDSPMPFARAVAQACYLRFERENASLRRGDLA